MNYKMWFIKSCMYIIIFYGFNYMFGFDYASMFFGGACTFLIGGAYENKL